MTCEMIITIIINKKKYNKYIYLYNKNGLF